MRLRSGNLATVTVQLLLNGHEVHIHPSKLTVQDGDQITLLADIELPIRQRPETVGEVLLVREVIRPKDES